LNGDRVVESIEPRPMEALGPFFVLDGAEAMKGLQGAGGLQSESGPIVADGPHAVEYLDGLVAFEREGDPWLQSVHGPAVRVSLT
jgi:hypothetical protein